MLKNLRLLKQKRSPIQEDPSPASNSSPNLLPYSPYTNIDLETKAQIVGWYSVLFVLILHGITLFFFYVNYSANKQLDALEKQNSELFLELSSQSSKYSKARQVERHINLYKEAQSTNREVYSPARDIFGVLPADVLVTDVEILPFDTTGRFVTSFTMQFPDSISVALLISRFLDLDSVKEVVLNSATLDTRTSGFNVNLEVVSL